MRRPFCLRRWRRRALSVWPFSDQTKKPIAVQQRLVGSLLLQKTPDPFCSVFLLMGKLGPPFHSRNHSSYGLSKAESFSFARRCCQVVASNTRTPPLASSSIPVTTWLHSSSCSASPATGVDNGQKRATLSSPAVTTVL